MGEIAEMMINGTMCQRCGEFLYDGEDGPGYAEFCASCQAEDQSDEAEVKKQQNALAEKIATNTINFIESELLSPFDPGISKEIGAQIKGICRGLYVNGHGVISHPAILMTIENNRKAQAKAAKRKQ